MKRPTLCLIFGGESSEYYVSLSSAYRILSLINREKYDVVRIGITRSGEWYLFEGEDEDILNDKWHKNNITSVTLDFSCGHLLVLDRQIYAIHIDAVLPIVHGEYAEDGRIQGVFDMAHLKYLGCQAFSSHICMDKELTKIRAQELGIPVAKWLTVGKNKESSYGDMPYLVKGERCSLKKVEKLLREAKISMPVVVKPSMCGSSVGVCLVKSVEELLPAIDNSLCYSSAVLIEEYIKGEETEVGVLMQEEKILVSCTGMIKHKREFYDYQAKYEESETEYLVPAPISGKTEKDIRECAKKLFCHLGCRGLARFDFFVTEKGSFVFNEVNTMPGFTKGSMFPMLFEKCGVDTETVVEALINNALRF